MPNARCGVQARRLKKFRWGTLLGWTTKFRPAGTCGLRCFAKRIFALYFFLFFLSFRALVFSQSLFFTVRTPYTDLPRPNNHLTLHCPQGENYPIFASHSRLGRLGGPRGADRRAVAAARRAPKNTLVCVCVWLRSIFFVERHFILIVIF